MEEKQNSLTSQDSNILYPKKEKEVSDIIKKFYKSNIPIEIIGSGSKKQIGKPLQCGKTISLSMLGGIIEYKPEELYIKVRAGTSISKIENELKKCPKTPRVEILLFAFFLLFFAFCTNRGEFRLLTE